MIPSFMTSPLGSSVFHDLIAGYGLKVCGSLFHENSASGFGKPTKQDVSLQELDKNNKWCHYLWLTGSRQRCPHWCMWMLKLSFVVWLFHGTACEVEKVGEHFKVLKLAISISLGPLSSPIALSLTFSMILSVVRIGYRHRMYVDLNACQHFEGRARWNTRSCLTSSFLEVDYMPPILHFYKANKFQKLVQGHISLMGLTQTISALQYDYMLSW